MQIELRPFDPDRTLPGTPRGGTTRSTQEYPTASCPACLRIAERRGVTLGLVRSIFGFGEGPIQAVSCSRNGVVVLVETPDMAVWVDLEEVA